MQRLRVLIALAGLALAVTHAPSRAEEPKAPAAAAAPDTVAAGGKVPALELKALLPGEKEPKPFDLGGSLGKRPVVFCYIRMGESLGEEALLNVQALAQGALKGQVDCFGAADPGTKLTASGVAERLSLLGASIPFVVDEGFALGRTLGATSAPSISLIDADGILRIPDARSLKQLVAPGVTLSQAIESASRRGPVPTVGRLPRYFPANELVGEQFPDFILKKFEGTERLKMSEAVARDRKDGKLPVLFFWHPNCTHCKRAMPSITAGFYSYRKWLDLISVVDLKNGDEVRNTADTIRAHKIEFPVLQDEDRRITDLYKVVSTPTFIFLRPDGVVDSVYTSGEVNYVTIFSAKIRSLLGAGVKKN